MPAAYGLTTKGKPTFLPWSHVSERMEKAQHYWICTVTPDRRPHATPVDGLWLDDRLYFGGSPESKWHRNLKANPAINVHLESATDLIILRGDARELKSPARSLAENLSKASNAKYGYGSKPEEYEAGGVYVFRPRVVIAWRATLKDPTRWQFEDAE
jgi:nitroimidazol reductase NimA-like FMN-containing flavoprotein (pyridoxamine 5'-phosphate oxidase superfamily)